MTWSLSFCLACVVATLVRGDEVLVTTPPVTTSPMGMCLFPEVLTVTFSRRDPEFRWTIQLKRDNVLPSERSVLFMSDTAAGSLEEVQVISDVHDAAHAYHNHIHGAAFTVKCARGGEHRRYFLLDGSVFLDKTKFRVTPPTPLGLPAELSSMGREAIYNMTQIEEFNARDSKVILASSSTYLMEMDRRLETRSRHKRDVTLPVTYNIDILTVVDSTLYARFYNSSNGDKNLTTNNIVDYLETLFTSVSMRLDTLKLENRTLKIKMMRPVLLTNSSHSPYNTSHIQYVKGESKIDALTLLNLFKNWLTTTINLGTYDHAMFLTSLNIDGGRDSGIKFNITKGLAFVGGMCSTNGESSSVITDTGAYQSEGVVAHEITHSMGSNHDGENNTCRSQDRYIMSDGSYPETDSNTLNPWRYSSCSSWSVLELLKTLEKNATLLKSCLLDSAGTDQTEHQTISADQQCKLFFGNQSFVCRGSGLPSFEKICDEFFCRVPGTLVCERLIAATGTCCGTQKKCSRGQCIAANQGECPISASCPLGDQPGVIFNDKTCAQLVSSYCYDDDIYLKCCDTCEKYKLGLQGCTYGNKQLGCVDNNCGTTFSEGDFKDLPYNFICCDTCRRQCRDQDTFNLDTGESYTCNDYIFNRGMKYICYQKDVLETKCCKSCEDARNATNDGCPWGDRSNCSTLLKKPAGYICTASQLLGCCYTCPRLPASTTVTPTTTPTTIPTTTSVLSVSISQAAKDSTVPGSAPQVKQSTTTCDELLSLRCGAAPTSVTSTSVLCLLVVVYNYLIKCLST